MRSVCLSRFNRWRKLQQNLAFVVGLDIKYCECIRILTKPVPKRQIQKRQMRQMSRVVWCEERERGGRSNEEKSCEKVGRPEGDELTPVLLFPIHFFYFHFFVRGILQASRTTRKRQTHSSFPFLLSLWSFNFHLEVFTFPFFPGQNETSSLEFLFSVTFSSLLFTFF